MKATNDMKRVVDKYVSAFNAGDLEQLCQLFSRDAEIQGVLGKGQLDKVRPIWQQLIDGFAIQLTVEDIISEGNRVAVRYTERGTFKAPAFGKEPTGKSYELVAMEFFQIENGLIIRRWGARDSASQAKQLGIESL